MAMPSVHATVPKDVLARFDQWIQDSDWEVTRSEVVSALLEYAVDKLDLDDLFEEEEEAEEEESEEEESEEEED